MNWVDSTKTDTNTPFMFTLCEDIYCRSLAPLMDTKKVKLTYDAIVTVSSTMSVYMSADFYKHVETSSNNTEYYFRQSEEITSNQIALVIGELKESVMNYSTSKQMKFVSSPDDNYKASQQMLIVPGYVTEMA